MRQTSKGQAAVEVLAYAGLFLLAFVASVAVFQQMQNQELERAQRSYAQEIALQFADQIKTAYVAGPGFRQNVTLPQSIHGRPYKILVSYALGAVPRETGFVYVDWPSLRAGNNYSVSVPTVTASYGALVDGNLVSRNFRFVIINASSALPLIINNTQGVIYFKRG